MKCFLTLTVSTWLMALSSPAQTVSGSTSGSANASASPHQASAGASANQNVQAHGASANANANASAQAQTSHDAKASGNASGNSSSSGSGSSAAAALSSGTNVQAELVKPLDAKKAKPGDQVTARVTQDVKSDGKVVIHKGSRMVGHVTEAQARTQGQANSTLGIAFDKAILKSGQEVSFNSVIQAIAPPVQSTLSAAADENTSLVAPPTGGGGSTRPSPSGGGGLLGGATSSVGGTVSGATGAVAGTTGALNTTASGAARTVGGLTAQGNLTSASQGAIGLQGLVLNTPTAVTGSAQSTTQASSVISSASHNVHLDSGTQVLLRVTGSTQ
jgi:hypothetical protein